MHMLVIVEEFLHREPIGGVKLSKPLVYARQLNRLEIPILKLSCKYSLIENIDLMK